MFYFIYLNSNFTFSSAADKKIYGRMTWDQEASSNLEVSPFHHQYSFRRSGSTTHRPITTPGHHLRATKSHSFSRPPRPHSSPGHRRIHISDISPTQTNNQQQTALQLDVLQLNHFGSPGSRSRLSVGSKSRLSVRSHRSNHDCTCSRCRKLSVSSD